MTIKILHLCYSSSLWMIKQSKYYVKYGIIKIYPFSIFVQALFGWSSSQTVMWNMELSRYIPSIFIQALSRWSSSQTIMWNMALSRYPFCIFVIIALDQVCHMHQAILLQNPVAPTLNKIFIYEECTSEFTHYTGQNSIHHKVLTSNLHTLHQTKLHLSKRLTSNLHTLLSTQLYTSKLDLYCSVLWSFNSVNINSHVFFILITFIINIIGLLCILFVDNLLGMQK